METKKILVVEDEEAIARALQLRLQREEYVVDTAPNGARAIEILEKEADTYGIVLLDLIMPVMDGFGVLQEMKTQGIDVPVIVATNLGQEEDRKRALELGAKDFFVKADTPMSGVIEQVKTYMR